METDIQSKVSASGTLEAKNSEIIYAEASNQILTIHKEVGDSVEKGDVVISFEPEAKEKIERELEKLELQLKTTELSLSQLQTASKGDILAAEANVATMEKMVLDTTDAIDQNKRTLEATKNDLKTAEEDYALTKELVDNGLAAEKELVTLEQNMTNLKDKIIQLETTIKSLEKDKENNTLKHENAVYSLNVLLNQVEDSSKQTSIAMKQNDIKNINLQKESLLEELKKATLEIVAPESGVITEVMVEEGQLVTAGAPLFKIIDPNALIVKCEVAPYYATQLKQGLPAVVKYSGSTSIEIDGEITKVSPTARTYTNGSTQSTTLGIEVAINGDLKGLKPGLVVDVKVVTEDVQDVVSVPLLATMEDKDGEVYLFVVKDDFTLEKRYVKQGASNNTLVQVSDVSVGETIVTNPTEALENGTIVNYVNPVQEEGTNK